MVQAKLLEVYRATDSIRRERASNELVLAINRSDYMLDEPSSTLLQVYRPFDFSHHTIKAQTPIFLQFHEE